ncbi:Malonyl CoA-acyl carrier protein transacylase [hydrothermal vent metagenome]|uniref:[acyl-carrier-protein] S-malonyltransferase n=1 Tax=hydrothermal vent metagenome TaxID=652676 RepID=A0A3B1BMX3_9ZZZZ
MSGNVAFLFPGQGSQFVGMGATFIESSADAKKRVEEASDALGFDIGKMILQGPEEELRLTSNTQPAILLVSVIALEALLAKTAIEPSVVAGHSLGEFSACWAAGAIGFTDVIRLVRKRGELMQSAVPVGKGGMAAIIGLCAKEIHAVCEEAGGDVAPANFNSPQQTVIAGEALSVSRAIDIAKSKGAKRALSLPVSAPFHTKMMIPAQEGLAKFLETIKINNPGIPVLRNVDGGVSRQAEEIKEGLIRQVTGCVQWVDSMRNLVGMNVTTALEIGPGKVLCGLMKRIDKSVKTMQVGSSEEVEKAVEALNG